MCLAIYIDNKLRYPEKRFEVIKDDNGISWQAKIGEINAPHWAVVPKQLIQVEKKEAITKWHLDWQYLFEELGFNMEVQKFDSTHETWRRADVLSEKNKTVVEFQHSPISSKEIRERTDFWVNLGYRVVWVFSNSWIEKGAKEYKNIFQEEMELEYEALGLDLPIDPIYAHKRLENMRYSRKPAFVGCDGYVFLETQYDYLCEYMMYSFLDSEKHFRHNVRHKRIEKEDFIRWAIR